MSWHFTTPYFAVSSKIDKFSGSYFEVHYMQLQCSHGKSFSISFAVFIFVLFFFCKNCSHFRESVLWRSAVIDLTLCVTDLTPQVFSSAWSNNCLSKVQETNKISRDHSCDILWDRPNLKPMCSVYEQISNVTHCETDLIPNPPVLFINTWLMWHTVRQTWSQTHLYCL